MFADDGRVSIQNRSPAKQKTSAMNLLSVPEEVPTTPNKNWWSWCPIKK
jgi:hypothetical protein